MRQNALLEVTVREPHMPRCFHATHQDLVTQDVSRLRALFEFLGEPFDERCVREDLNRTHSFRRRFR